MSSTRFFHRLVAPLLAGVVLVSSAGPPAALAATAVVSLDSTQKIHPLLQYVAQTQPTKVVQVIVQKTNFTSLGGGLLGSLLGPNVPGLQVIADYKVIPATLVRVPASSLRALAGLSNVRYVSPDAPVAFNPGLLSTVSNLLSPVTNLLSNLLGSSPSYPAPKAVASTNTAVNPNSLQTIYSVETGASNAWSSTGGNETGSGIGVAVIDSGFDLTHPDLAGRSIAVNLNSSATSTADGYGHGTHVAGIINSLNPTQQYLGIAPNATLIGVKVADDKGVATESDVLRGLDWVYVKRTTYQIRVVNMSVSTTVPSSYSTSPIDAAVESLWSQGVTVVAAAGNYGTDQDAMWYAPANDPMAITVGCLDDNQTLTPTDDSLCVISSHGTTEDGFAKPDLVAPGRKIVSALSSGANGQPAILATQYPSRISADKRHIRLSGTSMAAPMVTGAIALLLQRHSQLTPSQLKQLLVKSASVYPGQPDAAGELNIASALAASDHPPASTTMLPVPLGGTAAPSGAATLLWNGTSWGTTFWDGSRWSSAFWDGARWAATQEWDGSRWTSAYWDGSRWSATAWDGSRWSGAAWLDGTYD